jgi:hypothetical protein
MVMYERHPEEQLMSSFCRFRTKDTLVGGESQAQNAGVRDFLQKYPVEEDDVQEPPTVPRL